MSTDLPNATVPSLNASSSYFEDTFFEEDSEIVLNLLTSFVFLISIVGICGNSFVILIYSQSKQLHDATTKFILNLAATDLITAVFIGVYEIFLVVGFTLTSTSKIFCLIWEQILTLLMFVSQSLIAVATFDRYIAVCHHILYPKIMTKMVVRILLTTAWIFPVCLSLIPFFGFNYFDELPNCIFEFLLPDWLYITLSSIMILLMAIPFILYIQIFRKAMGFYRKFNEAKGKTEGNAADDARYRNRKKAIKNGKIMGTVTLIFIICWLPFQICQYLFGSNFNHDYRNAVATTYYLGMLNCTVNPFIYALQKKTFKEAAKKLLTCRRKIQSQHEKMQQIDDGCDNKNQEIHITNMSKEKTEKSKVESNEESKECKEQSKEKSKEVPKEEPKEKPKKQYKEQYKEKFEEKMKKTKEGSTEEPKEEPREEPKEKFKGEPKEQSKEHSKEKSKEKMKKPKEKFKGEPKEQSKEHTKEKSKEKMKKPKEESKEKPKEQSKEHSKEKSEEKMKKPKEESKEEPKEKYMEELIEKSKEKMETSEENSKEKFKRE